MANAATIHDKAYSRLQMPQAVDIAAEFAQYILRAPQNASSTAGQWPSVPCS
jgi:hypothetical protein